MSGRCGPTSSSADPWRRYRLHPDHRNAGFIVTDAVVAARDPLYFPEQELLPHRPAALLLFEADVANHVEDVSGFEQVKAEALLAHRSQHETTLGVEASLDSEANEAAMRAAVADIRRKLADHGEIAGLAAGESFHRLVV